MAETAESLPFMPFDDFDRIERTTAQRIEYYRGATYVMAGCSAAHNLIANNCGFSLRSRIGPDTCLVLNSNQNIVTPQEQANFLPDLVLVRGVSVKDVSYRAPNPYLVVEILSPSTRAHDLAHKLPEYQRIPSLRSILYIDSESPHVRLWTSPGDSTWLADPVVFQDPAAHIPLPLGVSLPMLEIYSGTGLLPS